MRLAFLSVPLFAIAMFGQDEDALTARRLYYQNNTPESVYKVTTTAQKPGEAAKPAPKVVAKPVTVIQKPVVSQAVPGVAAKVNKAQELEKIQKALRDAATTALSAENGPALKPVTNLGVRYNVLKVDPQDGSKKTEVSPDTIFHEHDCVTIRIQPNRGGFLYVFAEGSSGSFRPLLPSVEMADDSNLVIAYNLMDVPQNFCLEMDEKPGTERLLFVVTDKPEDVLKLNDVLRKKSGTNMEVAQSDLKPFTAALQGRDLKVTRIGKKTEPGEAPYSTYLTSVSSTTADRLVMEVKLKHEK